MSAEIRPAIHHGNQIIPDAGYCKQAGYVTYKEMEKYGWRTGVCVCVCAYIAHHTINTLRPRKNGRHLPDDIFKCIFLNENVWILLKISLKFVPKVPINNIPALVLIMAWRRPGDKPLSEAILVSSLTHICVTRPQWVNMSLTFNKMCICTK